MRASELIKQLQIAINEHGDLEVCYDAGACWPTGVELWEKEDGWEETPFLELTD
jgi:hypothetical protein